MKIQYNFISKNIVKSALLKLKAEWILWPWTNVESSKTCKCTLFKMLRPHTCTRLWTVVYLYLVLGWYDHNINIYSINDKHRFMPCHLWFTELIYILLLNKIQHYLSYKNQPFFSLCYLICYLLTILSKIQTLLTSSKQFLDFIKIKNHQT